MKKTKMKVEIKRIIAILFLPKVINEVINKPNHEFLEKVKNAAKPTENSNVRLIMLLKKEFLFSKNSTIQNGHIKLNHVPA